MVGGKKMTAEPAHSDNAISCVVGDVGRSQRDSTTKTEITMRVLIGIVLGLIQIVLVTFGCWYIADNFGAIYPAARWLHKVGPLIALICLTWPGYIMIRIDPLLRLHDPNSACSVCHNCVTFNS